MWCWASVGFLLMSNVVVHIILIACATFLSPVGGAANLQTDESLAAREYAKHGGPGGPTGDVSVGGVDEVSQLHFKPSASGTRLHKGFLPSLHCWQSEQIPTSAMLAT